VVISELQEETAVVLLLWPRKKGENNFLAGEVIPGNLKLLLLGSYQNKIVKGVVASIKELKGFKILVKNIFPMA